VRRKIGVLSENWSLYFRQQLDTCSNGWSNG
jgi:hypothetical protein